MAALKATLSTSNTTSDTIEGGDLVGYQGSSLSVSASYQVKYASGVSSGNFEVVLQAGFNDGGTVTWGEVATITQDNVNNPATLPIGVGLTYRFSRTSGVNVDVLLG